MRVLSLVTAALLVCQSAAFSAIKVGSKMPSVDLDFGFPPTKVNMASYTAGKKTLVVGLPGAFTPT
jgi:peroxiredoxin